MHSTENVFNQSSDNHTATPLPVGKLPLSLLQSLLEGIQSEEHLLQGPGVGLDCAIVEMGDQFLAIKSDPITFTAKNIGWYAVHINTNDIASAGAEPRWFMATLLLPEGKTHPALIQAIYDQIEEACRSVGAILTGGHTEITAGLDRPILCGTMIGQAPRDRLKMPAEMQPGDRLLLTKGIPIEAASILAHEFEHELAAAVPQEIIDSARNMLYRPGLSVLPEARIAAGFKGVHAMHDPTEGGLSGALWEMSVASDLQLVIHPDRVPILEQGRILCSAMDISPWEAIASGSLLLSVSPDESSAVLDAFRQAGITAAEIGWAEQGEGVLLIEQEARVPLTQPKRDSLAALLEKAV